jgi:hypothetical protein
VDLQKMATIGTATAVVGTGSVVGGGAIIDNVSGGPEKRAKEEAVELRQIVREEVRSAITEMMPKSTGGVVRAAVPVVDYREEIPKK